MRVVERGAKEARKIQRHAGLSQLVCVLYSASILAVILCTSLFCQFLLLFGGYGRWTYTYLFVSVYTMFCTHMCVGICTCMYMHIICGNLYIEKFAGMFYLTPPYVRLLAMVGPCISAADGERCDQSSRLQEDLEKWSHTPDKLGCC